VLSPECPDPVEAILPRIMKWNTETERDISPAGDGTKQDPRDTGSTYGVDLPGSRSVPTNDFGMQGAKAGARQAKKRRDYVQDGEHAWSDDGGV